MVAARMRRTLGVAMTSLALAACGSDAAPTEPSPPSAARWAEADSLTRAALAANPSYQRIAVLVYDANDRRVYEQAYGGFDPSAEIAVASASKLVAATVLLDVIARGALSLESTTGQVLGWTGATGAITLRHLLSFTSGLAPEATCTFNPLTTLAACVDAIRAQPPLAAPGVRYDYGSTHLHVAARMAEVATGRTWHQLFRERLADPLGVAAGARFYALPGQGTGVGLGTTNPLVAGGLRITTRDYARLLSVVFHRGRVGGVAVATPALFDAQAREPYPGVQIGASPALRAGWNFRYGFGAWLQCGTPATGCANLSSPGAFGFTPWVDRDGGYYAIVAMEEGLGSGAAFGTALAQLLGPAIERAIRGP
jgi:CubicO group peptidase (beta-lactamase class C family)